jgi:hypothetical protein
MSNNKCTNCNCDKGLQIETKSASAAEETFSSYEFEANALLEKDGMGREIFWNDMGRP